MNLLTFIPAGFLEDLFGVQHSELLIIIACFITSFIACFLIIPPTIRIAQKINLLDTPGGRKSHKVSTPRLGGISIFFAILLSLSVWLPIGHENSILYLFAAMVLIFIIGIKDDIHSISPWMKLVGQVMAASVIIILMDVRISSFYGILGITDISVSLSYAFTLLTLIVIINSFNLIDGINGLSASLTILCSLVLGIWFYLVGAYGFSTIAFALLGAALAFLYFNWSPARIFLGDSGSLTFGLLISVLILKFLDLQYMLADTSVYAIKGVPIVAMSILLLPLLDTIRVFTMRVLSGKSPLSPDRNHIHHMLIDAGYSHSQATSILVSINAIFVLLAFGFNFVGNLYLLIIVLGLLIGCAVYFNYFIIGKKQVL